MAKSTDNYIQRIAVTCALSATGDTATFAAFTDAYQPQDKIGWVIQEVEYSYEPDFRCVMNTTGDRVKYGLSFLQVSPTGGLEADDSGVIDHNSVMRFDFAAPAADVVKIYEGPKRKSFANLKSGGLLVHPVNLYAWTYPDSDLSASGLLHVVLKYYTVTLTPELYNDLWESVWVRRTT